MSAYFIMFECYDFMYEPSKPTDEASNSKNIMTARQRLLTKYIAEAEGCVGNTGNPGISSDVDNIKKPFAIEDLIEDEFEYLEHIKDEFSIGEF